MKVLFAGALAVALSCAATAQVAVLEIKVLDGEGAVHSLGAHVAHPITVEVTDENGKPVAGAAVSFQLPAQGPSGTFSNGLRTDLILTDAAGRAAIHSMQLNRTGGQLRIRITAVKEQARAGAISTQYISASHGAAPVTSARWAETPAAPAQPGPEVTPTTSSGEPPNAVKSGEITPTTIKMSSGRNKKKLIIAAIAVVGAAVAILAIRRAKSSQLSTDSSSVVSIGTPTLTIGAP